MTPSRKPLPCFGAAIEIIQLEAVIVRNVGTVLFRW